MGNQFLQTESYIVSVINDIYCRIADRHCVPDIDTILDVYDTTVDYKLRQLHDSLNPDLHQQLNGWHPWRDLQYQPTDIIENLDSLLGLKTILYKEEMETYLDSNHVFYVDREAEGHNVPLLSVW